MLDAIQDYRQWSFLLQGIMAEIGVAVPNVVPTFNSAGSDITFIYASLKTHLARIAGVVNVSFMC